MSKATPKFKNNKYIKDYMDTARQIEEISNGMAAAPEPQYGQGNGQVNAPGTGNVPPAPTPNEMAGDSTANR
jgi:hypothetical protein